MLLLAVIGLFVFAGTTTAEVFTNTFLVKMRQPAERHEADRVALRNGFINLGPVSLQAHRFLGNSRETKDFIWNIITRGYT